jgi:putative tryptophan/tyrosine transport system substrate-binding protein
MRRRTFIAGLGSAVAWPVATLAQQGDPLRRIGVLVPGDESDPEQKRRLSAFTQALADLGWTDGRTVRIDLRSHGDDASQIRTVARELVNLRPDIIFANSTAATAALHQETPNHVRCHVSFRRKRPWASPRHEHTTTIQAVDR